MWQNTHSTLTTPHLTLSLMEGGVEDRGRHRRKRKGPKIISMQDAVNTGRVLVDRVVVLGPCPSRNEVPPESPTDLDDTQNSILLEKRAERKNMSSLIQGHSWMEMATKQPQPLLLDVALTSTGSEYQ